ncbi:MAG: tRNA pseudouridine(55) synthase TruB [Alphaproteobacteria bacterium]
MGRKKRGNPINGWLMVDKPLDWTSTDVVNKLKYHLFAQKAGHGGTLDPLATGLLPIAFGEATKTANFALEGEKLYDFTVKWGESTNTDDAEGEVIATSDTRPTEQEILDILPEFTGIRLQTPPQFSAIKIKGQRAYDLARKGEKADIPAREVEAYEINLLECDDTQARFEVACSKGYYVRALARDLAQALQTEGHVSVLRRTGVGGLGVEDAIPLQEILDLSGEEAIENMLMPVDAVLDDIPAVELTADEAHKMRSGNPVLFLRRHDRARIEGLQAEAAGDEESFVLALCGGDPVALAQLNGAELAPKRVFNL